MPKHDSDPPVLVHSRSFKKVRTTVQPGVHPVTMTLLCVAVSTSKLNRVRFTVDSEITIPNKSLCGQRRSKDFSRRVHRANEAPPYRGPVGQFSRKGSLLLLFWSRACSRGPQQGWLVLVGAVTIHKSTFGCRKPRMHPKNIHYGHVT